MHIYGIDKVSPEGLSSVGLFHTLEAAQARMDLLEKRLCVEDAFDRNTTFILMTYEVIQCPKNHQSKK